MPYAHNMLRQVIAGEQVEPVEAVRRAKDGRRTVDTHRRRIREKMAAQSLPDLVDKARLCGILKALDT